MTDPNRTNTHEPVTAIPFYDSDIVEVDYEHEVPAHDDFIAAEVDENITEDGEITDAGWEQLAAWDENGEFV